MTQYTLEHFEKERRACSNQRQQFDHIRSFAKCNWHFDFIYCSWNDNNAGFKQTHQHFESKSMQTIKVRTCREKPNERANYVPHLFARPSCDAMNLFRFDLEAVALYFWGTPKLETMAKFLLLVIFLTQCHESLFTCPQVNSIYFTMYLSNIHNHVLLTFLLASLAFLTKIEITANKQNASLIHPAWSFRLFFFFDGYKYDALKIDL